MRISLNWLRDLVDFALSPQALAEALTLAGFEVEEIEDRATWADGVVVGRILEAETHPNADRLRVCQVDLGKGDPKTIVCGAANARAGITVAVATPGTYLPKIDRTIMQSELRGVTSAGMICSLAELGLAKTSAGIHEFSDDIPLGSDVRPLLGLDDVILDLTSTANRADALSMVGIAREVAALTRNSVRLPLAPKVRLEPIPGLTLNISDPKACPAYSGTLIRGIRVGVSPVWLQRRLEAAGTRSINTVVDITNLILLEWGQPLHAFDWKRLQKGMDPGSPTIGVRLAQPGETLKTLDGQERVLQSSNLVITAQRPVALAGVMGGEETEVNEDTTEIFLETALFDPVFIRRSARSQGLRTEASARYERGVDSSALLLARDRALHLILELAGGELVGEVIFDHRPALDRTIELRLSRLIDILGDDIKPKDVEELLPALGFCLSDCQINATDPEVPESPLTARCVWQVSVPSYRWRDIEREIDLIEEFARLYGYDRFSETLPPETQVGSLTPLEKTRRFIREVFRAAGLTELVHISLCAAETGVPVVITNPMSPEFSALRQELLPGLIEAFHYNWAQGNGSLNGFEIGRVFWKEADHYQEAEHLGGILGGKVRQNDWQHHAPPDDWYAAKGILMTAFERLNLRVTCRPESAHPLLHPGRTAGLWIDNQRLGHLGQLHPRVRQAQDLPEEVYAFELDLSLLLPLVMQQSLPRFQAFSLFPASDRDIAFFAETSISVDTFIGSMKTAAGDLLQSIQLFDDYRGEGVPQGHRSLAFRLIYRALDRTLTESEVESAQQKVRQALQRDFNVLLRS
jgi:phenylalanyl-tRNA synthetase beta chain